jgi:uncharacterized membrane protein YbjE (DUF340 family)
MITFSDLPLWVYAAVGIVILWGKMKKNQRNVYALTELVGQLISNAKLRVCAELVVFLAIGSVVAMGIIDPTTPAQAFAAGLGWTSLTTR